MKFEKIVFFVVLSSVIVSTYCFAEVNEPAQKKEYVLIKSGNNFVVTEKKQNSSDSQLNPIEQTVTESIYKTFTDKTVADKMLEIYTKGIETNGPILNIKPDCGAKGDGITNDTKAFQQCAMLLQNAGGGKLFIPKGTYIVGKQFHLDGKYPFYQEEKIFEVGDLNGFVLEGEEGTIIKLADNMRFGSFDKDSGAVFDPVKMNALDQNGAFIDPSYEAEPGYIFHIVNSQNVIVKNLEIDGNIENLILGGMFGDTGIQRRAVGLYLEGNVYVLAKNINTHDNGLDGIYITHKPDELLQPSWTPHVLVNIRSEYNARQGFSWTGGKGLLVMNSQFNHTGKKRFTSMPSSGVDIEPSPGFICHNGHFINCEFINNARFGLVSGRSEHKSKIVFEDSTFWGTTFFATYTEAPETEFNNCKFFGPIATAYGSPNPDKATKYTNCYFEDKEHPDFGVYRDNQPLINHDGSDKSENVIFDKCTIVTNKTIGMYITGGGIIKNSIFYHKDTTIRDQLFQSYFVGSYLENTLFKESFPVNYENIHHIHKSNVIVGKGVEVEGPIVRWGDARPHVGIKGIIPETNQNVDNP